MKQTNKRVRAARKVISWREEVRKWAASGLSIGEWMIPEGTYTIADLRRAIARFQPIVDRIRVGQQAKRKRDNAKVARRRARGIDENGVLRLGSKLPPTPSATSLLASGHTVDSKTGEMLNEVQRQIAETCDGLKKLLLEKNANYGNSAIEPARRFSQASPIEQILVRMDDKWSRMEKTGWSSPDEDTLQDFIGYVILLKVAIARGGK